MMIKIFIAFIVFSLSCHFSFAQIEGGIVDPTGKAVAHAKVIALDSNKTIVDSTLADERGFYSFISLKKGKYAVQVKATGFEVNVKENVKVVKEINPDKTRRDVSSATRLNFILNPLKKQ